jgi:hypothetical protein
MRTTGNEIRAVQVSKPMCDRTSVTAQRSTEASYPTNRTMDAWMSPGLPITGRQQFARRRGVRDRDSSGFRVRQLQSRLHGLVPGARGENRCASRPEEVVVLVRRLRQVGRPIQEKKSLALSISCGLVRLCGRASVQRIETFESRGACKPKPRGGEDMATRFL